MSRVTSKAQLLNSAKSSWDGLWRVINSMSDDMQRAEFKFDDRDKNLRDVLCHLHEWHNFIKTWHRVGCVEGGVPHVPAPGYTWKTINTLNLDIWAAHQETSLYNAKESVKASHKTVMWIIDSHSERELCAPGVYKWTGDKWSLGDFFRSSTVTNYQDAAKKLRKAIYAK